ncbi:heme exporter protein CcmB [Microbulbifer thermotolerans]|uniref:Heme exporter protein B n=2 Tax=Microbulbifer thermotolerans TaxID=252514 RepID=A0A143HMU9_MICTH|nr:heme exporter protein CcmB [Microbulbifer thermotolerans]AMX02780.1 heme exporter protein CcmB [Microbulbifer thermotolerans]MCX2779642.1 heme exporter protein CcmB [Microbulbifer thermotolerans]MCX2782608.1 heme exporter protein CcmB [Microbulbifer thermotolerans]MCX2794620.1 heme exporter protein CcmB [Microbulbifer thermotolerans]MCX2801448.1 heme exporter protein CcmB [Microbulbifer thermotolerans]
MLDAPTGRRVAPGFGVLFKTELLLALRHRADIANPLLFFVTVLALLPLGVGPEPALLAKMASGMIWVMALLATLLSQESLFRGDFENGSLEQMALSPQPLYFAVLAKSMVHWMVTGLPLALLSPLLGLMLNLPAAGYLCLFFSLLLGSASLSLVGAVGAALTVALSRPGLLLALIVMPLYVPVLIFGTGAVQAAIDGYGYSAQLAVLAAYLAAAAALAPLAAAGAIRISTET